MSSLENASYWIRENPILAYCLLAFGIAWEGWILFAASEAERLPFKVPVEVPMFAQYGPTIAAMVLVAVESGAHGVQKLLSRGLQWRVGIEWYVVVLFITGLVALAVILLHWLLGEKIDLAALGSWHQGFVKSTPSSNSIGLLSSLYKFASQGLWQGVLIFFLFAIANGGISEEFGWRGYALDKLQTNYTALRASLVIGVLWALWHFDSDVWVVLFKSGLIPFVRTAFLNFALYLAIDIPLAILFTWVVNNTQGSILMAILFHAAYNITFLMVRWAWPEKTYAYEIGAGIWIAALIVTNVFGSARLSLK